MPQISLPVFPTLTVTAVVDIIAVAFLIYTFFSMVRGRRAAHVLTGLCVLALTYAVAVVARLDLLRSVLAALAPYTAIALIVMFQAEIRRLLVRIGRINFFGLGGQLERREVTVEIILAVRQLAEDHSGALIVIERDIGLRTFIESGVALDAKVSRDLLCAIFQRRGALHDGAVIIQGDRVAAAACFLPLTTNPVKMQNLGTRHRAAIGITEDSDALAVVVSEDSGHISIASRGSIHSNLGIDKLQAWLTRHASMQAGRPERVPEPERVHL